ncbi:acyltransferase [Streptomyces sp. NPDC001536]|uniref:acyltransferase family protein n=1 Tax=Streptomyces sp. NPDC001536 TaxID=3364583 RepID=UPI0036A533E3
MAASAGMGRDRYVDLLRAWAIVSVVVGHWLITALVREPDGAIRAPELLAEIAWTQWLTLGFQVMPVFFLAGGYAAGGSWGAARGGGSGWVRRRVLRLLVPAGVYSGLVLVAVGVCQGVGVDSGTLELVGWAMAMQFWFLPVYVVLGALTPLLYAAHVRWGLLVPVGMGAVAAVAAFVPYGGILGYVLVWGVAYQLGFCWRDGLLRGKGLALAGCGGVAFAGLVVLGPYPVSLIRVTGQDPSNTDPPSLAMLAWVVAQVGGCLLLAPPLRRVLARERVWRVVRGVGGASMTLYLWHMLPVLVVAACFYLTGLAPQPALGSLGWWGLRVPWLVVLGVVMAGVVAGVRPLAGIHERVRLPVQRRSWTLWVGIGIAVPSLARFAVHGFAPDGRFPVLPALGLAVGTALVMAGDDRAVCDRDLPHRSSAIGSGNSADADAS